MRKRIYLFIKYFKVFLGYSVYSNNLWLLYIFHHIYSYLHRHFGYYLYIFWNLIKSKESGFLTILFYSIGTGICWKGLK